MIATHSAKMFNAKLKATGLLARIVNPVPDGLVCSQTVKMERELWAAPSNAANIKTWKESIKNLSTDYRFEASVPDIDDSHIKQILLPIDGGGYVCATPVPSMGVLNELYKRLAEFKLPYRRWVIQPSSVAIASHGDALLMQAGAVRMISRGLANASQSNWQDNYILLTARCEHMVVSSGMVAVGFPAITAIGGFVHSIERSVCHDIEFAIGIKNLECNYGIPKLQMFYGTGGAFSARTISGKINLRPGFSTEEITANSQIVLLLKTKADPEFVSDILKSKHRFAGGILFDASISIVSDGYAPMANYLIDASDIVINTCQEEGIDSLQAVLNLYGSGGNWVDRKWHQYGNSYILNQTGYAFLEIPKHRAKARANYPHVWVEPVFSLIKQGKMDDQCWWKRQNSEAGVFWQGAERGERRADP